MTLVEQLLGAPDAGQARRALASVPSQELAGVLEGVAQAILRSLREHPQRAPELAERAALVAETSGEPRHQARATWLRGHALAGVLRNEEALECYTEAADAYAGLGDRLDAARTSIGRVNTLTYLARYDEALAVGEKARRVLMRLGEPAAAARLDVNLANIFHRLERHPDALRLYERALRVAARLDDRKMAQLIQANRGNVLTAMGRLEKAERVYRTARRSALDDGEDWFAANVGRELGYMQLQRGDYDEAYVAFDDARATFEALEDHRSLTVTLIDLTELLLETVSLQRARATGRDARALAERLRLSYEAGRATMFLGIAALGLGELGEAEALLDEAASIFDVEGNVASGALSSLYRAVIEAERGNRAAAAHRLRAAASVFAGESMRLSEAAARVRLAYVLLDDGDVAGAEAEIDSARRLLRRLPSPWLSAQIHHLRGRLAERAGRPAQALQAYRTAVRGIEGIRRRIGIDEFRIGFAANKEPIYSDLVELILARGDATAVDEAFAVVERSRSRALVDLLAGRVVGRAAGGDPETDALLERLDKLRAEVNWLSGFEHETGDRRRNERRLAARGPLLQKREAEIGDLYLRLGRRHAGMGALTSGETLALTDAQAGLDHQTTLVEYYLSERGSRAFVITHDAARVVELPASPAEIARQLSRLRFQLEKCAYGPDYVNARAGLLQQGVDDCLRELGGVVWDPLGVDGEKVVVVPHGVLHSVPFQALQLADGRSLIDASLVTQLPSASVERYMSDVAWSDAKEASVLVVGLESPSIPLIAREVEDVRAAFRRGHVLRDAEATRARLAELAPEADVIHIATHGVFRPDDPHFSALRLADGWMSLHDVYGLEIDRALVCLSACQTGRSWVGGGDELVGLVRGFLFAGASALIVSLWPVQDASTSDLMTGFYRALRQGAAPAPALRSAMLELRERCPHPYYWAPFTLIGQPQA